MQTQKKNQNDYLAARQLISYCPGCHRSFSPQEAIVINQVKDTQLLHVTCASCTSSIVLLLLVNEQGMSSVGVVTDLTETDVQRVADGDTVTFDDCLSLHELLRADYFSAS